MIPWETVSDRTSCMKDLSQAAVFSTYSEMPSCLEVFQNRQYERNRQAKQPERSKGQPRTLEETQTHCTTYKGYYLTCGPAWRLCSLLYISKFLICHKFCGRLWWYSWFESFVPVSIHTYTFLYRIPLKLIGSLPVRWHPLYFGVLTVLNPEWVDVCSFNPRNSVTQQGILKTSHFQHQYCGCLNPNGPYPHTFEHLDPSWHNYNCFVKIRRWPYWRRCLTGDRFEVPPYTLFFL